MPYFDALGRGYFLPETRSQRLRRRRRRVVAAAAAVVIALTSITAFAVGNVTLGQVTLSAGVVALAAGETLEDALARADRLLYAAKADGRDRVCAG